MYNHLSTLENVMAESANQKKINLIKKILPYFGLLIAILIESLVPNHRRHPDAGGRYYLFLLCLALAVYTVVFAVSVFVKKLSEKLEHNGPFYFGVTIIFAILNFITAKKQLMPALLFPSFDNILAVFVEKPGLMLKNVASSFELLSLGILFGVAVGFFTGVLLGFSRRAHYWLNPIIKVIGPVPATAWIPVVLVIFPTVFGASVFLVALAVWFPVVLLTSAGIQNIPKVYFEVGKTLGSTSFYQVVRIAIPAALPNIFQGIFFGVCSAFVALMTGEMFGVEHGIGQYIMMCKETTDYKGIYASLILMVLFCSIVIAILFKIRGYFLKWQKGLVKY